MSKSKLNKRQLKKISRIAAEHILRNKEYVGRDQLFFDIDNEDGFHGEFGFWSVCNYFGEYQSDSAIDYLFTDFFDKFINYEDMVINYTPMKVIPPMGFKSLSFCNAVHYMIKFLEGK